LTAPTPFTSNPSYWWPDDRAWCVCTDTDLSCAYIAGSADYIRELLSVPVPDAYPTRSEDPGHAGIDVINDPGGSIPPADLKAIIGVPDRTVNRG